MAQDSLTFRFAVVLALAVIILVVMTLAAPPCPANDDTATPIVSSNPIYRAQYLKFVLSSVCTSSGHSFLNHRPALFQSRPNISQRTALGWEPQDLPGVPD